MHRPSPATTIASIALFFSLAGTGLAASKYLITSTKQIKPSVLKSLKGAEGPRGLQGPQGAAGANGANGAPGAAGTFSTAGVVTVFGNNALPSTVPATSTAQSVATCPAGDVVIGGGYSWGAGTAPAGVVIQTSNASGTTAWAVSVANTTGSSVAVQLAAEAICAS